MIPVSKQMPWTELIEAFVANLPIRSWAEEMTGGGVSRAKLFKEYRTLTIGGYRQCGKTSTAFKMVRDNPDARLMGTYLKGFPSLAGDDVVVRSRIINIQDISAEHLFGVKLLFIDTGGYKSRMDDPYTDMSLIYDQYPSWFDPEFSVIHIL
jgi:hypothetical protein